MAFCKAGISVPWTLLKVPSAVWTRVDKPVVGLETISDIESMVICCRAILLLLEYWPLTYEPTVLPETKIGLLKPALVPTPRASKLNTIYSAPSGGVNTILSSLILNQFPVPFGPISVNPG